MQRSHYATLALPVMLASLLAITTAVHVPLHAPACSRFFSRAHHVTPADGSVHTMLHQQGWAVLPSSTILQKKTHDAIHASIFTGIFNGQRQGESPTRLQGRSTLWAPGLELLLAERCRPHGLLACEGTTRFGTLPTSAESLLSLVTPLVSQAAVAARRRSTTAMHSRACPAARTPRGPHCSGGSQRTLTLLCHPKVG